MSRRLDRMEERTLQQQAAKKKEPVAQQPAKPVSTVTRKTALATTAATPKTSTEQLAQVKTMTGQEHDPSLLQTQNRGGNMFQTYNGQVIAGNWGASQGNGDGLEGLRKATNNQLGSLYQRLINSGDASVIPEIQRLEANSSRGTFTNADDYKRLIGNTSYLDMMNQQLGLAQKPIPQSQQPVRRRQLPTQVQSQVQVPVQQVNVLPQPVEDVPARTWQRPVQQPGQMFRSQVGPEVMRQMYMQMPLYNQQSTWAQQLNRVSNNFNPWVAW